MVFAPVKSWAALRRRTYRMRRRGRRMGVHVWLRGNPYHHMLYQGFDGADEIEPLLHADDLDAFVRGRGQLLAVHSEQSYSWGQTGDGLERACTRYARALTRWVDRGGSLAWTIHDTDLHLADPDPSRIARLRKILIEQATFVHVHSEAARQFAADELKVPEDRLHVIAHPSYAPCYPVDAAAGRVAPTGGWRLMCFGYLKDYKNYDGLAAALGELPAGSFQSLTIAGQDNPDVVLPETALRATLDLDLQVRYIDDAEVPGLFNRTDFLVLPYTKTLTSGATALSLGFGVPVIAPDMGGMREAVAPENIPLLYDPTAPDGLRDALGRASALDGPAYDTLRAACLARADDIHPSRVSQHMRQALHQCGLL